MLASDDESNKRRKPGDASAKKVKITKKCYREHIRLLRVQMCMKHPMSISL